MFRSYFQTYFQPAYIPLFQIPEKWSPLALDVCGENQVPVGSDLSC
jgi:hypothetical protein